MTDDQVRELWLRILHDQAPEADMGSIDENESLREQLDIDSIAFLHAVQRLADETGVIIPELEVPRLDTLDHAVATIRAKLQANSG